MSDHGTFAYGTPYVRGRANVRERVNPRITVPLLDLTGNGREGESMNLTVPQCLELIGLLSKRIGEFCRRADIAESLRRTEPLS